MRVLQEADASLDAASKVTRDCPYSTGVGSDGPLGQQWTAGGLELEGVLTPLNDRFKYISTMDLRLTNSTAHGLYELYIDDLVVFGETWAHQLEHLMRLQTTKLGAKAKKCKFKATQCVYLGHVNQQTFLVCCWIRGEECGGLRTFACVLYSSPVCVNL